jgi:hypothetical protein
MPHTPQATGFMSHEALTVVCGSNCPTLVASFSTNGSWSKKWLVVVVAMDGCKKSAHGGVQPHETPDHKSISNIFTRHPRKTPHLT